MQNACTLGALGSQFSCRGSSARCCFNTGRLRDGNLQHAHCARRPTLASKAVAGSLQGADLDHSTLQPASSNKRPFSSIQVAVHEQHAASASPPSGSKCPFSNEKAAAAEQHAVSAALPDVQNRLGLSVSFPPREYLPFKDEAYKIDLQFDRIPPSDIFEIDEYYVADMQRKAHILATRPPELLYPGVDGSEPVQREVLATVAGVLTSSFPDRFHLHGNLLTNATTGESFALHEDGRSPMEMVARLVQEDVAVMQWIDGRMILSCGAVVSPLGWSASRKLGLDLQGIHEPVPHFNDGPALKFVSKIFHKGLKAGVPLARANWFIMDTSEHSLFADPEHIPAQPEQGPITLENAGDRLFLRCERQVTTRLPQSQAVMFSFRTYIRPLRALEERSEVMQRLLAAFTALPDEVVAYRHINVHTRQMAVAYLQQVAQRHG